ncbi:WD40 repeat-like protein [Paxillus ammoniavirescens]|nr:WD40 repeat-like protein [Paxillus ammoniavirescens]
MSDTSKKSVDLAPKPLLTLSGHEGTVFRVTYIAGGERLVTCSYDKTVRIWNVATGEQEGLSMEHNDGWLEGLAVTGDGKRILSGGQGKRLVTWDVETCQVVEEWLSDDTTTGIRCIAMSPFGDLVASGHSDGDVIVREMDGGTVRYSLKSGSGDVNALCFSPDGRKLACGGGEAIRVFNLDSGDLILGPIEGHTNQIFSVLWSLDGSQLFTGSWDSTIRHWDFESGAAIRDSWTGHTGEVTSISLSPDGTKLASVSLDNTLRFWGTDSSDPIGEPLHHDGPSRDDESATESPTEPLPTAPGHYARFSIIVESVSSSDSLDGNQATAGPPQDNSEPVQGSCCSLFSRRRGRSGTASAPPVMGLTQRAAPTPTTPPPPVVSSPHLSTPNVTNLPAYFAITLRLLRFQVQPLPTAHVSTLMTIGMSDTSKKSVELINPKPILTLSGHEDTVFRVTYIAGGERLVTCSYDKTVRIWNAETGEQEGTSMEHNNWIEGLGVTRDEKIILSGGDGKGLRIWDVGTHQLAEEWPSDEGVIRCIAMSPNGDLVASGHSQGGIIVREMDGGTVKCSPKSGSGEVIALCFSPDGTKIACGGDRAVRVFDVDSGDLILGPIEGHTDRVFSVVWSLDGSRLFTSSSDQTIRHWDSKSGEAIGEPWMGHTDYVKTISLSPDGTKLTSVSRDKTVRFWDADSGNHIGEPLHHEGHM